MTKRDRNMTIAWMLLFGFAVVAFLGVCDANATLWQYGKVDLLVESQNLHIYAVKGHIDESYLKEALIHPEFDGISTIYPQYYEQMNQTWVTIECWEGCPTGLFNAAIAAEIGMARKRWADLQD